jgi:hypothetical protein
MLVSSESAPSAVFKNPIASFAFRTATRVPRTCEVKPSEIASFLENLLSDQKNAENENPFIVINEVDEKNATITVTLEKSAIMKLLDRHHSSIESITTLSK